MSTTTSASTRTEARGITRAIQSGIIAGLGGGILFGLLMAVQGMLPMVGMLVRQENALVGFVVHMLISAFIGATFGLIATRLPSSGGALLAAGALYGVIWWVLGALILMPLMLGMNEMVFAVGQMQWMSLVGHLIFGVVLGFLFHRLYTE